MLVVGCWKEDIFFLEIVERRQDQPEEEEEEEGFNLIHHLKQERGRLSCTQGNLPQ